MAALATVASVVVAVIAVIVTLAAGSPGPGGGAAASAPARTYIFAYGTSMPGHLRYGPIEEFVAAYAPDRVTGRLYDTGVGYPAAKFGGGQAWISGYRLEIRKGREAEALRAVTSYESGLFEPVQLRTEAGYDVTAWEWIGSAEGFELLDGIWDRPEQ